MIDWLAIAALMITVGLMGLVAGLTLALECVLDSLRRVPPRATRLKSGRASRLRRSSVVALADWLPGAPARRTAADRGIS